MTLGSRGWLIYVIHCVSLDIFTNFIYLFILLKLQVNVLWFFRTNSALCQEVIPSIFDS